MYKLTVISGPNRGTSYAVQEGETTIGRQTGNQVVLPSSKVSKKHCVILVRDREVMVKDLGSSNGTFVNGILVKLKPISPGDRVSVGEFVFELVEPAKRKMNSAPAVAGFGNARASQMRGMPGMSTSIPNEAPKDLKGKALWYFENRVMPIFYGLNLKHEWSVVSIGLFAAFIVTNLVVSVYPLLESSRTTIIQETQRRARFMAKQIAEHNAPFLAVKAETKTEIGMIESAEGVRLAVLLDLDNRIIAPTAKLNQYLASGVEASVAVQARDRFREGKENGFSREADSETVVAIEPVKVLSPAAGRNVVVGMALVSIDTSLATPDLGEMGMVYSETLILTGLIGGLILLILYRLTLRPFEILNEDLDKALKGDLPHVTHEYKIQELDSLWEIINSAVQRIPKSEGMGGGGANDAAESGRWAEESLGPFRMLGDVVKVGLVVLDSEKKVAHLNSYFEEISGIRSDSSIGQLMSEVARDQAMGAFATDILDRTPVGGDGINEDYDFSGVTYKVYAAAFGTSGGPAKGYILVAVRTDG